ncbi:MAG: hypothetical protein JNM39_00580 [Bdellovibrionaceae bacterium]|nr:hypothetical protein [Pseudobdellovibrionaceae bacterium]
MAGHQPFVRSTSFGEINEIALDLDKDGLFDYFDISWGPLNIRKTYVSRFKGELFVPSFEISFNLKNDVYYAYYLCDSKNCRLTKSVISKTRVSRAQIPAAIVKDKVPSSTGGAEHCDSDSRAPSSIKENRDFVADAMALSIADSTLDPSCRSSKIAELTSLAPNQIAYQFREFLEKLGKNGSGELSRAGKCLAKSPDLEALGTYMRAKLDEIFRGKESFTVVCEIDETSSKGPEMTRNPIRMKIPVPTDKTCNLNFTTWFAHEFGHMGPGNEAAMQDLEDCFGTRISAQFDSCKNLPQKAIANVSEASAANAAAAAKEVPVNIKAASLMPAEPKNVDRGIASVPSGPSEGIIQQALGVVDQARGAAPAQFAEAGFSNLSYFDVQSGGNGGNRPTALSRGQLASNSVLSRLSGGSAGRQVTGQGYQQPSNTARADRADRGILAGGDGEVSLKRGSLKPAVGSIATTGGPVAGAATSGSGVGDATKLGVPPDTQRGPASAGSDPAKLSASTSGVAGQQGSGTKQPISQSGSVAKITGTAGSTGGAPGVGSKLQSGPNPTGGSAQNINADGTPEAVKHQITIILDKIATSVRANSSPGHLEELKSKYGSILAAKNVSVSFGSKDPKNYLGVPADQAKLAYRISDGKITELPTKKK